MIVVRFKLSTTYNTSNSFLLSSAEVASSRIT